MKEVKHRNKYLHKKVVQGVSHENGQDATEEPYAETGSTKWYDEIRKETANFPESKEEEIVALKAEAEMILRKEEEFFSKKASRNGHPDKRWLRTVMTKGTASDKVAASVVTVQDNPVYNLPILKNLVNNVKISKKKECLVIMETLTELFTSDLLRPGRKLQKFEQQPLSLLKEFTSGNAVTRRKYLSYWAFEDQLKTLYAQFINALDVVSKDTVDAHREKAVTAMYKLLSRNPEQEAVLLKNLVNKLGDPNQKVVSKVIYSLTQLLRVHPVMKQVVSNEIELFLFRPNIGPRAQYYAICFLSQYIFTVEDAELAENLISVYFSFFKGNIKKGDIDSRMMGALLMGVNRAFPFAKMDKSGVSEHVDTLYKLVHISHFNISLQTLCLLYQISGKSSDRFYCALYKKLLDPQLAWSAHQAMFVNLVFKALRKDNNVDRVRVFIKRLLQVCLSGPSQLSCALLYLVSQLIAKSPELLALTTHGQEIYVEDDTVDDEEEHYKDAPLETENIADTSLNDVMSNSEEKSKPGWFHCKNSAVRVERQMFDSGVRNPAHAGGEYAAYEELTVLASHFHPTVALFARNILDKQLVKYSGDPLHDFTLLRFLERFVFKNPKQQILVVQNKGPDPCLAHRKHYAAKESKAMPVNSSAFLQQDEKMVPVDEMFLYRYLQKSQPPKDKIKEEDYDSDVDSVASEEFDEMLDKMVGKVGDDLDFADDVGDKLRSNKKIKHQQKESESEEDMSEDESDNKGDEDLTDLEDDNSEAIDFDDNGEDFDGEIDIENLGSEDDDFEEETRTAKTKKNNKGRSIHSMFAPAEKFSEMLEEAGVSKHKVGTAQDVSNMDNAGLKQLEWESSRIQRMYGLKRKQFVKGGGKPSFNKTKRKKH